MIQFTGHKDEEFEEYQEAAKKFFSSGYNKYQVTMKKIDARMSDSEGFMYLDFERLLRMQLEICIQTIGTKDVIGILWQEVDLLTQYLSNGRKELPGMSRQLRSRDRKLASNGDLFTARSINKAVSILCNKCTYHQLLQIIKRLFSLCGGSFYQIVVWDIRDELERENPRLISCSDRIHVVYPVNITKKSKENGKVKVSDKDAILVLVNTKYLLQWLATYTRELCFVRSMLKETTVGTNKRMNHSLQGSIDYLLRTVKSKRYNTILEAYKFVIGVPNVKIY